MSHPNPTYDPLENVLPDDLDPHEVDSLKCIKCKYEWVPRTDAPKSCPNCKSRYWKDPNEQSK